MEEQELQHPTPNYQLTSPSPTKPPIVQKQAPKLSNEFLDKQFQQSVDDIFLSVPTTSQEKVNPYAPTEIKLKGLDRYKGLGLTPSFVDASNREQLASQTQGYGDRLWNDFAISGAKFLSGFTGGLTSDVDMINNAIVAGNPFDTTRENGLVSAINTWSNDMIKDNVNYETAYDRDNPILSVILPSFVTGSSKGWGEVLQTMSLGIGTTAGMVAEEGIITALTGGVGTLPTLANNIRKLAFKAASKMDDVVNAVQGGTSIAKNLQTLNKIDNAIDIGATVTKGLEKTLMGKRVLSSAYVESAFEGVEAREGFERKMIDEFTQQNGYSPNGKELEKIKDLAHDAGQTRFWLNLPFLMMSNAGFTTNVFKNLDDVTNVNETLAKLGIKTNFTKDGIEIAEKQFKLKSSWWDNSKVGKFFKPIVETTGDLYVNKFNKGRGILGNIQAWEGAEEGYQFWVDKATDNYYTGLYNGENNKNLLGSMFETMGEIGSDEGIKSILTGILAGTGQTFGLNLMESVNGKSKQKRAAAEDYITTVNESIGKFKNSTKEFLDVVSAVDVDSLSGKYSEKLPHVFGIYNTQKLVEDTNNTQTLENLKDATKFHLMIPYLMKDQGDIMKAQLDRQFDDLSIEEFNQLYGKNITSPSEIQSYKQSLKESINDVSKELKIVNQSFPNKYKVDDERHFLYNEAKKMLVYNRFMANNIKKRSSDLEAQYGTTFMNSDWISDAIGLDSHKGKFKSFMDSEIVRKKKDFQTYVESTKDKDGKENVDLGLKINHEEEIKILESYRDRLLELKDNEDLTEEEKQEKEKLIFNLHTALTGEEFKDSDFIDYGKILNNFIAHKSINQSLKKLINNYQVLNSSWENFDKVKEHIIALQQEAFYMYNMKAEMEELISKKSHNIELAKLKDILQEGIDLTTKEGKEKFKLIGDTITQESIKKEDLTEEGLKRLFDLPNLDLSDETKQKAINWVNKTTPPKPVQTPVKEEIGKPELFKKDDTHYVELTHNGKEYVIKKVEGNKTSTKKEKIYKDALNTFNTFSNTLKDPKAKSADLKEEQDEEYALKSLERDLKKEQANIPSLGDGVSAIIYKIGTNPNYAILKHAETGKELTVEKREDFWKKLGEFRKILFEKKPLPKVEPIVDSFVGSIDSKLFSSNYFMDGEYISHIQERLKPGQEEKYFEIKSKVRKFKLDYLSNKEETISKIVWEKTVPKEITTSALSEDVLLNRTGVEIIIGKYEDVPIVTLQDNTSLFTVIPKNLQGTKEDIALIESNVTNNEALIDLVKSNRFTRELYEALARTLGEVQVKNFKGELINKTGLLIKTKESYDDFKSKVISQYEAFQKVNLNNVSEVFDIFPVAYGLSLPKTESNDTVDNLEDELSFEFDGQLYKGVTFVYRPNLDGVKVPFFNVGNEKLKTILKNQFNKLSPEFQDSLTSYYGVVTSATNPDGEQTFAFKPIKMNISVNDELNSIISDESNFHTKPTFHSTTTNNHVITFVKKGDQLIPAKVFIETLLNDKNQKVINLELFEIDKWGQSWDKAKDESGKNKNKIGWRSVIVDNGLKENFNLTFNVVDENNKTDYKKEVSTTPIQITNHQKLLNPFNDENSKEISIFKLNNNKNVYSTHYVTMRVSKEYKMDSNERLKSINNAIKNSGQGEGGIFTITLVDGSKHIISRISYTDNEVMSLTDKTIIDINLIVKIENPDGTITYNENSNTGFKRIEDQKAFEEDKGVVNPIENKSTSSSFYGYTFLVPVPKRREPDTYKIDKDKLFQFAFENPTLSDELLGLVLDDSIDNNEKFEKLNTLLDDDTTSIRTKVLKVANPRVTIQEKDIQEELKQFLQQCK